MYSPPLHPHLEKLMAGLHGNLYAYLSHTVFGLIYGQLHRNVAQNFACVIHDQFQH